MAKADLEYGIQECSKCEYKLRCEECVYNGKDMAALIEFEKQQTRKDTAREILKEILYVESPKNWENNEQLVEFGNNITDKIDQLADKYGVEV